MAQSGPQLGPQGPQLVLHSGPVPGNKDSKVIISWLNIKPHRRKRGKHFDTCTTQKKWIVCTITSKLVKNTNYFCYLRPHFEKSLHYTLHKNKHIYWTDCCTICIWMKDDNWTMTVKPKILNSNVFFLNAESFATKKVFNQEFLNVLSQGRNMDDIFSNIFGFVPLFMGKWVSFSS